MCCLGNSSVPVQWQIFVLVEPNKSLMNKQIIICCCLLLYCTRLTPNHSRTDIQYNNTPSLAILFTSLSINIDLSRSKYIDLYLLQNLDLRTGSCGLSSHWLIYGHCWPMREARYRSRPQQHDWSKSIWRERIQTSDVNLQSSVRDFLPPITKLPSLQVVFVKHDLTLFLKTWSTNTLP